MSLTLVSKHFKSKYRLVKDNYQYIVQVKKKLKNGSHIWVSHWFFSKLSTAASKMVELNMLHKYNGKTIDLKTYLADFHDEYSKVQTELGFTDKPVI